MNCKICGGKSEFFGKEKILNKHEISYFRCGSCGFIQTEEPYWLDEAYAEVINASDLGLVNRNLYFARILKTLLPVYFDRRKSFVDYGGGYGLLVRMMRDEGFEFYRSEKFCKNLFAVGFDAESPGERPYELLTSFEVFEHLADPIPEIERMLRFSRNILFSTELLPSSNPLPKDWWYYGTEHGQHISFFTRESLSLLARRFGLNFYTNGKNLHLFTDRKLSSGLFALICRQKISSLLGVFFKNRSLLEGDYQKVVRKPLQ